MRSQSFPSPLGRGVRGEGKSLLRLFVILVISTLTACATPRPHNVDNVCSIFKQYPSWYRAAKKSQRTWGVPIPVQMAFIHQESRFTADARPARTKLLWIIPWVRPSTSYGYTQALNITWKRYERERGGMFASRDSFASATDFIGWYAHHLRRRLGISPANAEAFYLAYHEGVGGYARGTYRRKPWLMRVAKKVARRAWKYKQQLKTCERSLNRFSIFNLF